MTLSRKPIQVEKVIELIWKYRQTGITETVKIQEDTGRFLGEDIIAKTDVPWFDKSPYDGFALRAEDTKQASSENILEFEVIDHIGAGTVTEKQVQPFQAIRIMTGAQIPKGCDSVIMLELVKEIERNGKNFIQVKRKLQKGENVSFQGEDIKLGASLVEKGTKINPGIQSLLATFGYHEVKVMRKPKIGVFATGDELLDVDQPLVPGKIRNSNSYMILEQIERSGADATFYGQIPDTFDATYEALKNAMNEVDLIITTGGVSVGDFDYMPKVYDALGAEILCNKIAMRPGSVTTIASLNGKLLYGLSGNPSACYVGFELFVRPIIRNLLGSKKPFAKRVKAILDSDFPKPNPFNRYVRSKLYAQQTQLFVSPIGMDKSNIIFSLAFANCLMILPGGTRGYEKGMEVEVLLLEDQEGSELF
jgi:molybdopterin molybdotransferase